MMEAKIKNLVTLTQTNLYDVTCWRQGIWNFGETDVLRALVGLPSSSQEHPTGNIDLGTGSITSAW